MSAEQDRAYLQVEDGPTELADPSLAVPSGQAAVDAAYGLDAADTPAVPFDDLPERKIAIVGYTSSRDEAPLGDRAWELWGMNNLHQFLDPNAFTRWYNLHSEKEINEDAEHLKWLRAWNGYPIFLMDPLEGITIDPAGNPVPPFAERSGFPAAVTFPKRQIEHMFGTYFTNTVSWQIAHALLEALHDETYRLSTIGLFGVDMAVGTEYAAQRPSVEYFLGLARGMGVEIVLPQSSDLLKTAAMYGGHDDTGFSAKMGVRLGELETRKQELEQQMQGMQQAHAATCGAIDTIRYVQAVWLPPAAGRDSRDSVVNPEAVSHVGQSLAEAEHRDRHKKE